MAEKDEANTNDEFDDVFDSVAAGNEPEPPVDDDTDDDAAAIDDEEEEYELPEDTAEDESKDDTAGDDADTDTFEEDDDKGDDASDDKAEAGDTETDWKAEFEALQEKTKSWSGRLSASDKRNTELQRQLDELKAKQEQGSDDDDDNDNSEEVTDEQAAEADAELEEFFDDYPGLRGPLTKMIEKAKQDAIATVQQDIAPIKQERQKAQADAEEEAVRKHVSAIEDAVPGWEAHTQDGSLTEWLDSLPRHRAIGVKAVLADGETHEVIDVLTDFRKEIGYKPPADNNNDDGEKTGSNKLKELRKRQAEDAEAVKGGQARIPKGVAGKDDFDSAFDEAAAS